MADVGASSLTVGVWAEQETQIANTARHLTRLATRHIVTGRCPAWRLTSIIVRSFCLMVSPRKRDMLGIDRRWPGANQQEAVPAAAAEDKSVVASGGHSHSELITVRETRVEATLAGT